MYRRSDILQNRANFEVVGWNVISDQVYADVGDAGLGVLCRIKKTSFGSLLFHQVLEFFMFLNPIFNVCLSVRYFPKFF